MQTVLAPSGLAFAAYTATAIVLSLNLIALWVTSGGARAKSGMAINPEDGALYRVPVSDIDPPGVARYLRAHRNAEATIYPFLIIGLVYVLQGAPAVAAIAIFAAFTVARLAHSVAYLGALQPWRTITFAASLLVLLALMVATAVQLAARFTA